MLRNQVLHTCTCTTLVAITTTCNTCTLHSSLLCYSIDDLDLRIVNINEYFTFSLYSNVCRSLFEKHKLLFSFLLCVRILMNNKKINMVS